MAKPDLSHMRKQYHFWAEDGVRDAWDVDHLIELSENLPIQDMPLADMDEVDEVYWFDADAHKPTVRAVIKHAKLIAEADLSYPIIMGPDGRVMDGMHRMARAVMEGHETISVRRFARLPEPDHRNCGPEDLSYER